MNKIILGLCLNSVNYQSSFLKEKYHLRIEILFEMDDQFQGGSSSIFGYLQLNQWKITEMEFLFLEVVI